MTREPPTDPDPPGSGEHRALVLLADRLTEAGFDAAVDPGPAFPILSVLIPGTRTLREMVLISGGHYTWDAGQAHYRVDDPSGAAAALVRHIGDLADRLAARGRGPWVPTSPDQPGNPP